MIFTISNVTLHEVGIENHLRIRLIPNRPARPFDHPPATASSSPPLRNKTFPFPTDDGVPPSKEKADAHTDRHRHTLVRTIHRVANESPCKREQRLCIVQICSTPTPSERTVSELGGWLPPSPPSPPLPLIRTTTAVVVAPTPPFHQLSNLPSDGNRLPGQ